VFFAGVVMVYRILVFNQRSLGKFDGEELRSNLLEVNFESLCAQYGLDPAQIETTKSHIEVVVSKDGGFPYFLVNYGSNHFQRPLVVYEWSVEKGIGKQIVDGYLHGNTNQEITDYLMSTKFILEIELKESQLRDMGLLLAYEIARWGANLGEGVILSLDNVWYRLNQHQAFISL
jgi:hypothetical protein